MMNPTRDIVAGALAALIVLGCVDTRDCTSNTGCATDEECHLGYCKAVCWNEGSLSEEAACGASQRCACVSRNDNERCSDREANACRPGTDKFCLCVEEDQDCTPRCFESETCVRGLCVKNE